MNYQQLKSWIGDKGNQKILVIVFGFILVFFVGLGIGSYVKPTKQKNIKSYINNTTNAVNKLEDLGEVKVIDKPPEQGAVTSVKPTESAECIVKGNIGSGGTKIYHIKGGSFYIRVKPEMCFKTSKEAEEAGFTKSSR